MSENRDRALQVVHAFDQYVDSLHDRMTPFAIVEHVMTRHRELVENALNDACAELRRQRDEAVEALIAVTRCPQVLCDDPGHKRACDCVGDRVRAALAEIDRAQKSEERM